MAVKTLEELNNEFLGTHPIRQVKTEAPVKIKAPVKKKEKGQFRTIITTVLLVLAILLPLVPIISAKIGYTPPGSFMGYSFYSILSGSMGEEIPKSSLLLAKYVEPENLKVGDDITFKRDEKTITHKITAILTDENGTGSKAFKTQGINNAYPDKDTVSGDDIIGKVIFVIPGVGSELSFLESHVYLAYTVIILLAITFFLLHRLIAWSIKRRYGNQL